MKTALFALGALALGAWYYLDPKRAPAHGAARRGTWSGSTHARRGAPVEPGEIEEIAGSPAASPTSRPAAAMPSEIAPGTSGISTAGAPTSGTGAYGIGASGAAPSPGR